MPRLFANARARTCTASFTETSIFVAHMAQASMFPCSLTCFIHSCTSSKVSGREAS